VRIADLESDDANALHIALGHGIEPEEAEEVFAVRPLYRKTKDIRQWLAEGIRRELRLTGS
jgi:hypothetical protein